MNHLGIEAFLAVVRTQNITKASEQLHLAHSTVSKRIRVLEEEVGAILIERGKGLKSVHLTPTGEYFAELAERWDSLNHEMTLLQSESLKMVLSIGVLDTMINSFFPSLYAKLIQHQYQYRLKIITGHSAENYDLIERRQVDVAFSLLEQTHQSVQVEKCLAEPLVILRTAAFAQTPPQIYHPTDLDSSYELYLRWSPSYQLWHDTYWASNTNRIQLDTSQLIVNLLREDKFWAIVPLSVAKSALQRGNFSICYLSDPPPERYIYKLTHKYPKASTVESLKIFDHCLQCVLSELQE